MCYRLILLFESIDHFGLCFGMLMGVLMFWDVGYPGIDNQRLAKLGFFMCIIFAMLWNVMFIVQ